MRDWRTIRRWVVAACMVIAPVAVAVIRALIPYSSSPSEALAASLAHANLYPVLAAAEVIVVFTMGFAMLGLGRLIQGRAPLLALIGTPVAVLSWILGGAVLGTLAPGTQKRFSGRPTGTSRCQCPRQRPTKRCSPPRPTT